MTENRSIRIDSEDWQLREIQEGIQDLDRNMTVSHDSVIKWLESWGKADETMHPLADFTK